MQKKSGENILPNLPVPNATQTILYNEIMAYAKDLAKQASKSLHETEQVISTNYGLNTIYLIQCIIC